MLIVTPLTFLGGAFYSIDMLPGNWKTIGAVQSDRLPDQRLPLELLWHLRCRRGHQPCRRAGVFWRCGWRAGVVDFPDGYRLKSLKVRLSGTGPFPASANATGAAFPGRPGNPVRFSNHQKPDPTRPIHDVCGRLQPPFHTNRLTPGCFPARTRLPPSSIDKTRPS